MKKGGDKDKQLLCDILGIHAVQQRRVKGRNIPMQNKGYFHALVRVFTHNQVMLGMTSDENINKWLDAICHVWNKNRNKGPSAWGLPFLTNGATPSLRLAL